MGTSMNRTEAAAVLGVSASASRHEIQAAARTQLRLLHPDRFCGDASEQAKASAMFQRILRAREVLLTGEPSPDDTVQPPTSAATERDEPRQSPRTSRQHPPRPRSGEPRNDHMHRHQRSNAASKETARETGAQAMANDQLKSLLGVCAVVLTLLVGIYLFTSTPMCEIVTGTHTEREICPGAYDTEYPCDVTYESQWVETAGECRDIEVDSRPASDS